MKDAFILLCMLALVVGGILFIRQQNIMKEQHAAEMKRLEEAIKAANSNSREGEIRRMREDDSRRAAHLEKVGALQKKLIALRSRLATLRDNRVQIETDETKAIQEEIAKIDNTLNDKLYECYDYCIKFNNVKFVRIMKHPTDRPDDRGYYQVMTSTLPYYKSRRGTKVYIDPNVIKDGKHVFWEPVPVCYVCEKHNLTWTEQAANHYKHNVYVERTTLETNKSLLRRKLAQLRQKLVKQRPQLITDVKEQITATEAELASLVEGGASAMPVNTAAAQPAE